MQCAMRQGMELLRSGSTEYKWDLNLSDIATIWRGGSIIRAKFLNRIVQAYRRDPALHNLLLDRYFTRAIKKAQPKWRLVLSSAIKHGVAAPAFSASLKNSRKIDPAENAAAASRRGIAVAAVLWRLALRTAKRLQH